jgi:hypothetical protein
MTLTTNVLSVYPPQQKNQADISAQPGNAQGPDPEPIKLNKE